MQPLQPNRSYHIFNHANGFENVFREDENYRYFLEKYRLYISPIAETYCYCLMPNHFHLVIRIRKREIIEQLILSNTSKVSTSTSNTSKVRNFGSVGRSRSRSISDSEIEKYLSKQFANFFSSYTQSFNKMYKRMGSLFIKNFKRQLIGDKQHFYNAVIYTHRNPIHHGFRNKFTEWHHSSYNQIVENQSEMVEVDKLIKTFGNMTQFLELHHQNLMHYIFDDEPLNNPRDD